MAALASLTANYTDSEEEDDANEEAGGEAKDSTAPSSNADEASNLSAKSASRDEFSPVCQICARYFILHLSKFPNEA